MAAKSSYDYWKEREEYNRRVQDRSLKRREAYLKQAYNDMMRECNRQIEAFYARYAAREGITMAEAKARVSQADIRAYERKAQKYVAEKDFSPTANEEMALYNLTMRINRLELLKAELNLELTAGYDSVDKYFRGELANTALDTYKDMAGILGKSVQDPAKRAESLVNASFQNATFSQRLWQHHDALMAQLTTDLTSSIIRGDHPRELARTLKKRFDASTYAAERLMITETARIQTDAQMQSFTRNGYDSYVFITEGNPCPICARLDGQSFRIKDMHPGENAPPMHPICRCAVAADMNQEEFEKWLNSKTEARKMLTKREAEKAKKAEKPADEKTGFTPAKTIEEAEKYAERFLYSAKYGKANYSQMTVDGANSLNKVLTQVFDRFKIQGLDDIKPINFREKRFKDTTAEAVFYWGNHGSMYFNGKYFKNAKTYKAHLKEITDLQKFVNDNIDVLLEKHQNDRETGYLQAIKKTKSQCFAQKLDPSLFSDATFVHECGHMLDSKIFYKQCRESGFDRRESMKKYGGNISGYATSMVEEYMAESFASWWYGQTDGLDPALVEIFERSY